MKFLRIEPFSGISGDMFLGALLDLGAAKETLLSLPAILGLPGATIRVGQVDKCGIHCTKVTIEDDSPSQHRHLSGILAMIEAADLPGPVQARAGRIFTLLGEAEAAVHGIPVEKVHFHEVGAVDSILDIVGTALLLEEFDFDRVLAEPVCTGFGTVECAHGRYPVPAPATERLLQGMPTFGGEIAREMTTPTGAAILRALDPEFSRPALTMARTGYGAGTRDLEQPNCLRLGLGTVPDSVAADAPGPGSLILMQTNLDDASGELLGGHFQDLLFSSGALDVSLCPLLMKKGRPGQRLEVLCRPQDRGALADIILTETPTIGVRWFPVQRTVLPRRTETVATRFGEIRVKGVTLPSGEIRWTAEYEDCRRRSQEGAAGIQQIMQEALVAAARKFASGD